MKRLACFLLAVSMASCDEPKKSTSFESPRGTITYVERDGPGKQETPEVLHELTNEELQGIQLASQKSTAFVERYVPLNVRVDDPLENLDLAFKAWLASTAAEKESESDVEKFVGAALGEYCVAHLDVKWMKATDSKGTEFALVGKNPESRSYPFSSVRYRIEDHKTDFVGALYETLRELRKSANAAP